MPRQTFFNLPDEKRQAILEIAIGEFATNDYQSASISRMVTRLGIAKGSFYQYFEDKLDLYLYVLDIAIGERLAFVTQQVRLVNQSDFFAYVQELLESGLRYDLAHPRLGQIIYRAMFSGGSYQKVGSSHIRQKLLDFQRNVLAQGITVGAIAPDINLDLAAHMLNAIMGDFGSFAVAHLGLDIESLIQGDTSPADLEALRAALAQSMRILRYGLAPRSLL